MKFGNSSVLFQEPQWRLACLETFTTERLVRHRTLLILQRDLTTVLLLRLRKYSRKTAKGLDNFLKEIKYSRFHFEGRGKL